MTAVVLSAESSAYLSAVESELADLPADDRGELVAELAAHLAALDAEEEAVPLASRLGAPGVYAAELRASAGLPPRLPSFVPSASERVPTPDRDPLEPLRRAVGWVTDSPAVAPISDELRVAWWVARAALATFVLAAITGQVAMPVPYVLGSRLVGLVTFALLLWGSITLGRRSAGWRGWGRFAIVGGGLLVLVFGLAAAAEADRPTYYSSYPGEAGLPDGTFANGQPVSNLFVYDRDGNLLRDVLIYDQNGQPVVTQGYDDSVRTVPADANGAPVPNAYPAQVRPASYNTDGTVTAGEPLPPPAVVIPRLDPDGRRVSTSPFDGVQEIEEPFSATTMPPVTTAPSPTTALVTTTSASATTATAAPSTATTVVAAPTSTADTQPPIPTTAAATPVPTTGG